MVSKMQTHSATLKLIYACLFVLALALASCSRQQSTRGISVQPTFALPKDSPQGQITLDTAYLVTVHPSVPTQVIRLIERIDTTGDRVDRCSYQILVTLERDTVILQSISRHIHASFDMMDVERYPGITFIDANFDGYTDIQMFDDLSMDGQTTAYVFYLFNPKLSRFELDEAFSERFGSNSIIDPKNQEITVGGGVGCGGRCYEIEKYRLVNSQFTLVERNRVIQNDSTLKFISTKEVLKGDRLVVVESDTTD